MAAAAAVGGRRRGPRRAGAAGPGPVLARRQEPGARVVLSRGAHRVRGPADEPDGVERVGERPLRRQLAQGGRAGPGGRPARAGWGPRGLRARHALRARAGRPGAAPWVALVARGGCTFKDKVLVAARRNASAVVVYNKELYGNLTAPMSHAGTGNIVVIMISYPKGREILDLVQKGIPVKMTIGIGTRHVQEFINGQSVVFVAIAFITMMIISLAWLIFYYIQRFLYTGSQFGRQSHRKETKKVIGQLPLHTVKHGEKGIDVDAENCAVCIENFKVKDIIRILPCKHIFHRICIDPWLLDHRTCPMCKLDVIKALGYWGEPEAVQELPAAEPAPRSVSPVTVRVTLQDDDDSSHPSSLLSASASEAVPQDPASFKEDAGENTALLDAGRSDPQHGGPAS